MRFQNQHRIFKKSKYNWLDWIDYYTIIIIIIHMKLTILFD